MLYIVYKEYKYINFNKAVEFVFNVYFVRVTFLFIKEK